MKKILPLCIMLMVPLAANAQELSTKDLTASLRINAETTRILNELVKRGKNGDAAAAVAAVKAYMSGLGAKRNDREALRMAILSANAGNAQGIRFVGDLTQKIGKNSEISMKAAILFWQKSAMLGNFVSMSRLAQFAPKVRVKVIQDALNQKGYKLGTVDGIAGRKTVRAFADFCKAQGIVKECVKGLRDQAAVRAAISAGLFKAKR